MKEYIRWRDELANRLLLSIHHGYRVLMYIYRPFLIPTAQGPVVEKIVKIERELPSYLYST